MTRKTTLDEVAQLAGVSIATVDRVLNGRGGVTPAKEHRVLSTARLLKVDRILSRGYTRVMRVAVLIQSATNPFHAALRDAFAAAAREYADLNLQFLVQCIDPNSAGQTAATVAALSQRHDALIVSSSADVAIEAALRRAASVIPVLTLATDIPNSGRHAYVGPDDLQGGRVAGDLMGQFLGPAGGDVLMIAGLLTMVGQRQREAGFRAVLQEHYPACRVSMVQECREEPDRAGCIALTALRDNPRLRGIYHTSAGVRPVVAALRQNTRKDVVLITHELTEARRALLKQRAIRAVVDQNPVAEVRTAVETMARLLGRLDGDPASILTPVQIFTAENV
jgi:LacI family transcriptional regulator